MEQGVDTLRSVRTPSQRELTVLSALTETPQTISEIAKRMGLHRNQVHRAMAQLADAGVVLRSGDRPMRFRRASEATLAAWMGGLIAALETAADRLGIETSRHPSLEDVLGQARSEVLVLDLAERPIPWPAQVKVPMRAITRHTGPPGAEVRHLDLLLDAQFVVVDGRLVWPNAGGAACPAAPLLGKTFQALWATCQEQRSTVA